jgi:hypothetical protein
MAAAARVHRSNELNPRRERDVRVRAGNADIAGLEGLAQENEHGALEFGKLIEEQDAELGEADLARTHAQTAANERGHGRAVVRSAERFSSAIARRAT